MSNVEVVVMGDLRYPIGEFVFPKALGVAEREGCIGAIAKLPAELRGAIAGLSEEQFGMAYRPDGWNVRQVVHHLADSHINCFCRFKFALTETSPTIKVYDEGAWAALPDGDVAPVAHSLSIVEGVHARWVFLLEHLSETDWARSFVHPVYGEVRLFQAVAMYAWHGAHHVAHITSLREREGF